MASTKSVQAWRGCSSSFPQPLDHRDELEALKLMETLDLINNQEPHSPVYSIQYRGCETEHDILCQVFRWDLASYEEVFEHGFRVKREHFIRDECFYNLYDYVHDKESSQSLDSRTKSKFGFISTTISNSWCPPIAYDPFHPDKHVEIYRYEIYAPGGIWSAITLGDHDHRKVKRYDEVVFVLGIAPQYVRSAQLLRLKPNPDRTTTIERVGHTLIINDNFNPQSHPLKLLELEMPICDYTDENRERVPLQLIVHQDQLKDRHGNKPHSSSKDALEWYTQGVTNIETYIDAAFRSSRQDEAYYIQKNRCALVDYAPGGTDDKILDGPSFMRDMFESLKNTPFGQHGVDCAFGSHDPDEAYIFCANLCALINYGPHSKNDKILEGPTTIARMFAFLEGTVFEGGIDAAFETTTEYEAYFFRGNQCGKVNYSSDPRIISVGAIPQMLSCLKGTVFETRVDAAYASHFKDEAYLFSHNNYGKINFASDTMLYSGKIGSQGPGIASLFPLKNRGLDLGTPDGPVSGS